MFPRCFISALVLSRKVWANKCTPFLSKCRRKSDAPTAWKNFKIIGSNWNLKILSEWVSSMFSFRSFTCNTFHTRRPVLRLKSIGESDEFLVHYSWTNAQQLQSEPGKSLTTFHNKILYPFFYFPCHLAKLFPKVKFHIFIARLKKLSVRQERKCTYF